MPTIRSRDYLQDVKARGRRIDNALWKDLAESAVLRLEDGYVDLTELGSGTPDETTFLRGDGTWAEPEGGGGGSGTVTSVALTAPSILSVAGSPVTTNGTLALTLATQLANLIFSGPTSGGAATPTFRALVAADIPSLSAVYLPLGGGTLTGALTLNAASLLLFGGSTTSFPALKRNAAILEVKLANDSAYADLWANNLDLPTGNITQNGSVPLIRMAFGSDVWFINSTSGFTTAYGQKGLFIPGAHFMMWQDGGGAGNTPTLCISRPASTICRITKDDSLGATIELVEMTAPAAPAANGVRIYAVDNGGKTQLVALFNSGAAQQIAIEP